MSEPARSTDVTSDELIAALLAGLEGVQGGPYKLDKRGSYIWAPSAKGGDFPVGDYIGRDDDGIPVMRLSGWGYYTGKGHGALGLTEDEAEAIQRRTGEHLARCSPENIRALLARISRAPIGDAVVDLANLIKTRLLGVPSDDQDVRLEDADWQVILNALAHPFPQGAAADPICVKCASQQEGPVPTECTCGDYPQTSDTDELVERIEKAIDWFKTTGTHQTTVKLLGDLSSALTGLRARISDLEQDLEDAAETNDRLSSSLAAEKHLREDAESDWLTTWTVICERLGLEQTSDALAVVEAIERLKATAGAEKQLREQAEEAIATQNGVIVSFGRRVVDLEREIAESDSAFTDRVFAEHGTTIDILSKRLDEYAERIEAAEQRVVELTAALTEATAERDLTVSVEQQKIAYRDKLIAAAETQMRAMREALAELLARERRRYENTPKAIAFYESNNAAAIAALAPVTTPPEQEQTDAR
jgi:septal ring factor EnvC (AmiA/AmiB activator)